MDVLLIEDEGPAARRLQQLIKELAPQAEVLDVIDTVEAAVRWLQHHQAPDIIFMDIQLADGLSFDILEQVPIQSPVIFTTAYDDYAIRAFTLNSIDYLLKPVEKAALARSLQKHENLSAQFKGSTRPQPSLQELLHTLQLRDKSYKTRFLVSVGDKLFTIPVEDIAYFTSEDKAVRLVTLDHHRYLIDFSLDKLETLLNPRQFFRLNRQFIGQLSAIKNIHNHFNGKLKVELQQSPNEEIFVSRERATAFKDWLDG
jgi:DNA-binding LytR/AlgR family response regulator